MLLLNKMQSLCTFSEVLSFMFLAIILRAVGLFLILSWKFSLVVCEAFVFPVSCLHLWSLN